MALTLTKAQESAKPAVLPRQANMTITTKDEGIADLSHGREVNIFPIPETIDVTVTSVAGTNAADKVVYLLNQDTFQNVTDNGKGGASITYTYGDGNTCKTYNKLFQSAMNGQGVKIYGFNIDFTDVNGNAVPSAITTAALKLLIADGSGNTVPANIKIQKAKRNTAQDRGLLTVKWVGYFNCLAQISLYLPVGVTASVSLFTTPDFE